MKISLFFLVFVIFSTSVTALSVTGGPMPVTVYYEQGFNPSYTYQFGTDSMKQDYFIIKAYDKGYDITPMLEISKTEFKDVPQNTGGEGYSFFKT